MTFICVPVIFFILQWDDVIWVFYSMKNWRRAYFVQKIVLHTSNVSKYAFSLFSLLFAIFTI